MTPKFAGQSGLSLSRKLIEPHLGKSKNIGQKRYLQLDNCYLEIKMSQDIQSSKQSWKQQWQSILANYKV